MGSGFSEAWSGDCWELRGRYPLQPRAQGSHCPGHCCKGRLHCARGSSLLLPYATTMQSPATCPLLPGTVSTFPPSPSQALWSTLPSLHLIADADAQSGHHPVLPGSEARHRSCCPPLSLTPPSAGRKCLSYLLSLTFFFHFILYYHIIYSRWRT